MRPDLVSKRTREAVRDQMSGTVLREIDEMWQDELFAPPLDDDYPEAVGGQRVTHFQAYMNKVDWAEPGQVARALRVFEVALRHLFQPRDGWQPPPETIERLQRLFNRDGYDLTLAGKIISRTSALKIVDRGLLSNLTDPSVIHEHLERIGAAIERNDPALAIGSAKELVESTAKLVLSETGTAFSDRDDVPELVRKAAGALHLSPGDQSKGPDGSEAVRKILGAASTIANRMAELRNQGYGTGHGQSVRRAGLSTRHARLAINGARLWCEFMLDTLADPNAPWRRSSETSAGE